jgi:hypothetical protein
MTDNKVIMDELKRMNDKIDKLEELHRLVHDLLIEYITLKKVVIPEALSLETVKITEETESVPVKKSSLKKKTVLSMDDICFKIEHDTVENSYYQEYTSKNYVCIEDKISDVSANNKVNVYKYLYVHFNDMRKRIIEKLDCENFIINLYQTQKKFKDLTEMLKYECIEIHKQYKDKEIFKKLLIDLKKDYDKVVNNIA